MQDADAHAAADGLEPDAHEDAVAGFGVAAELDHVYPEVAVAVGHSFAEVEQDGGLTARSEHHGSVEGYDLDRRRVVHEVEAEASQAASAPRGGRHTSRVGRHALDRHVDLQEIADGG